MKKMEEFELDARKAFFALTTKDMKENKETTDADHFVNGYKAGLMAAALEIDRLIDVEPNTRERMDAICTYITTIMYAHEVEKENRKKQ